MFRDIKIRRLFLTIMAFAVFYVFLGSLINFHANRIIGTELLAQAYPSVKAKTKENTVLFLDNVKAKVLTDFVAPLIIVLALAGIIIPFILFRRRELQLLLYSAHD